VVAKEKRREKRQKERERKRERIWQENTRANRSIIAEERLKWEEL